MVTVVTVVRMVMVVSLDDKLSVLHIARKCKIVQENARQCKIVQENARQCKIVQDTGR